MDSPNSPLSINNTLSISSNMGIMNSPANGKYINLKNFESSENPSTFHLKEGFAKMNLNNSGSSSPFGSEENVAEDGLISITSTESDDDESDNVDDYYSGNGDYVEFKADSKKEFPQSGGSSKPSSAATQYGYNKLNLEEEEHKNIVAPKRSSMRLKSTEQEPSKKDTPVVSLKPSAKPVDFKKFLNSKEPLKDENSRVKNRLTVLNIRDSILNFENIDALKKYLNFAENGEYNN